MFAIFTYLLFLFSYSYQLLIFYELNQYRLGSIKDILKIIIILVIRYNYSRFYNWASYFFDFSNIFL